MMIYLYTDTPNVSIVAHVYIHILYMLPCRGFMLRTAEEPTKSIDEQLGRKD